MYITLGDIYVLITLGLCMTRALRFVQIWPIAVFCSIYFAPTSASIRYTLCVFAIYCATMLRIPTWLKLTLPALVILGVLIFANLLPAAIHLADVCHLILIRAADVKERRREQVITIGAGLLLAAANAGLVVPALTWAVAAMMLHAITTYAHVYLTTMSMYHHEEALAEGPSDALINNSNVFASLEFMHLLHSRLTLYHLLHGAYSCMSPAIVALRPPLTNFAEATSRTTATLALRHMVTVLSTLSRTQVIQLLLLSNEATKMQAAKCSKSHTYDPALALDWALDQIFYRQMTMDPESVESVSRLAALNDTPLRDLQPFVQSILNPDDNNSGDSSFHAMRSQVSSDFHQALDYTTSLKPLVQGMSKPLQRLLFGAKHQAQAIAVLGRIQADAGPLLADVHAWIRGNKRIEQLLICSLTWTDECTCVPLFPFLVRLKGMPKRPNVSDRRQLSGMSQREMTLLFPLTLETSSSLLWTTDKQSLCVLNHLLLFLWCVLKAGGMPARVHALYWSILRAVPARMADLAALRNSSEHPLAFMKFCLSVEAGIVATGVDQGTRDMAFDMLFDAWKALDTRVYCRVASQVATRALKLALEAKRKTWIPLFASVVVAVMGKFQLHVMLPDWPPPSAQSGLSGPPLFHQHESREFRAMFTFSMSQFCATAMGHERGTDHTLCVLILMLTAFSASLQMGMTIFSAVTHLVPMEIRKHIRAEAMANFHGNARNVLQGRSQNALDQLENAKAEKWFKVSLFMRNHWADVEWQSSRRTSMILEDAPAEATEDALP